MNRRHFLERSALALAAIAGGPTALAGEAAKPAGRPRAVFTKTLEPLGFDELAEKIATLGVSGIEAPIRAGGHINPDDAEARLPAFVAALAKQNLELTILTSDINAVDREGKAERLLKLAAGLGIKRYRLAHLRYDLKKPIQPQIGNFRARLKDLAALNAEVGIQGQYQNHRGNDYVGGPIWDMVGMLDGIDPAHLGMAFDFAHATVEGANTWELNLRRAAPHIVALYFKDYRLQGRQWQACPLGEGVVNPRAGELVGQLFPPSTPVSLHVEYLGGPEETRSERTLTAMRADLATLATWLP
jgi:sugar phosphate isomerase/epimerase